ncbi:unnamed protein product [Brachionus calyciflorus]|uniref:Uncharacterized protein n=1 Tax=Brachionus calyciflorus TaxID=104777 RepID=A0A813RNI1_9BILA|nr:unnamed protein product [Brachionus calyciflorus]
MKWEVIEEGEKALLYHYNGKVSLKQGPKRLWLVASKLKRLEKFTAHHNEYLAIELLDGYIEHKIGPCSEVFNPLVHLKIRVEKCYCLDTNQAIVTYTKTGKENKSEVNIIKGPGIFMIQPNEWVHKFSWHGEEENSKVKFVANKNKFEVLNCAPDQLYYNVDEVRTSDDALIRIKLMIFYELKDIAKMLNETKDPIADILNCSKADVIAFTARKTYLNFLETCHLLNELTEFPKLVDRSEKIGYEITKVVFRGYFASPKLQALHDSSIKTRTDLKLKFESEIQQQKQLDQNLKNDISRLTTEQELEFQKLLNHLEMNRLKVIDENRINLEEKKSKIEMDTKLKLKDLENLAKKNEQKLEHLEKLNQFNIDLTDYLVTSLSSADKHVKIVKRQDNLSGKNNENSTNIHFHE